MRSASIMFKVLLINSHEGNSTQHTRRTTEQWTMGAQ